MKTTRRGLFAILAAPLVVRLLPAPKPNPFRSLFNPAADVAKQWKASQVHHIDLEEFSRLYLQPAMLALANKLDARILEKPPVWLTNSHRAA